MRASARSWRLTTGSWRRRSVRPGPLSGLWRTSDVLRPLTSLQSPPPLRPGGSSRLRGRHPSTGAASLPAPRRSCPRATGPASPRPSRLLPVPGNDLSHGDLGCISYSHSQVSQPSQEQLPQEERPQLHGPDGVIRQQSEPVNNNNAVKRKENCSKLFYQLLN